MSEKICLVCGNPIPTTRKSNNVKYCSAHCLRRASLTSNVRQRIVIRGRAKSKRIDGLLDAYNCKCAICEWGLPYYADYQRGNILHQGGCEFHHIIPVEKGGSDEVDNLILLCPNHHKMADLGIIKADALLKYRKTKEDCEHAMFDKKIAAADIIDTCF